MYDVYREIEILFRNYLDYLKKVIVSITEIVDVVNALIFSDRWANREDISEKLGISVGKVYKSLHDDPVISKVIVAEFLKC